MSEWIGTGKTRDAAIERGLARLEVKRDDVNVVVLEDRTSLLFSLFGFRQVKVKLTVKKRYRYDEGSHEWEDEREEREPRGRGQDRDRRSSGRNARGGSAPEPEQKKDAGRYENRGKNKNRGPAPQKSQERKKSPPPPPREPREQKRRPRDIEPAGARTTLPFIEPQDLLTHWKELLGWDDVTWDILPESNRRIPVLLKTARGAAIAGNGGKVLEAFEYLFNVVSCGGDREKPWVSFRVDGFASTQEHAVVDKALHAAFQVRRTGTPVPLEPMNPAERRLVHQTLANHPDVETASAGEGADRRVIVKPRPAAVPTPAE